VAIDCICCDNFFFWEIFGCFVLFIVRYVEENPAAYHLAQNEEYRGKKEKH